jgi:hypothetical protein
MRLIRVLAFLFLLAGIASAQSTTAVTGTFRDLTGALITSGQVAFTLQPGIDTQVSGTARFTPTEVDCLINGSGVLKALDGVSTCTLVQNTSITTPSGTSYKACVQPNFIQPGSCFVMYAIGSTLDITTVPATPSLTPAYNLVDTFSNQTIGGVKTFSNAIGAPNLAGTGSCSNSFVTVINSGGSTPTCGSTANNFIANQGTNSTDALSGSRATDSSPTGNFINFKSLAGVTLFKVDVLGNIVATSANIPSFNTTSIFQSAATLFTIFDNQSGIRFQIPLNGTSPTVVNNAAIAGASTLGGTAASSPLTPFNRLGATRGTALTAAKVGSLTGFGTTASVGTVIGTDSAGFITINSSGTGQSANATFVITFADGTWTNNPIVVVCRSDANSPQAGAFVSGTTATAATIGILGTPVAGTSYSFFFIAMGR